MAFLVLLLLLQGPGDGWTLVDAPPREVARVYWDLFQTTEVWVRLLPEGPRAEPPRVHVIAQAYFPGRAERDPYSALPRWPRGKPARLTLRVQPFPLTVIRELSLVLVIDDETVDLTGPDHEHAFLGCPAPAEGCAPNAVEAAIDPSLLESLITAESVRGEALGFPIELGRADRDALADFATRIGLRPEELPR